MNEKRTEFSDERIIALSCSSLCARDLWAGTFDFAVLGASWDRRSVAVTTCRDLSFRSAIQIIPVNNTATDAESKLLDTHVRDIGKFCSDRSVECFEVKSETSNLGETLVAIRARLWQAIATGGRRTPARIFIDITTCPRYFSLSILAEAFRSGIVGEIILGYSEGTYPVAAPSYGGMEDISFTDGPFHSIPVPGYFGEFEPRRSAFYVVSTGFDGWKTLNLLVRKEPDRVAALIASPSANPDYERRANTANEPMFTRFGVTGELLIRAPASDAVWAWQNLTKSSLERFERENVFYLCSGNKAHSVALALRAISTGIPTLLYNRPLRHVPVDISCSGVYWSYSIKPASGTIFGL